MNFHKTIGYLAALLLIVGIGAPDSFAQDTAANRLSLHSDQLRKKSRPDPSNVDWTRIERGN